MMIPPPVLDPCGAAGWTADQTAPRSKGEIALGRLAMPWWLWWNVLSLDAPTVAVAWALAFAKSAGVRIPGAEIAALGLVVWLIYTVDRLLDGQPVAKMAGGASLVLGDGAGAFGSPLRQRHVFHRIHARAIGCAAAAVAVLAAILVGSRVREGLLEWAVPLGLILVLYMAWVHLGRGSVLRSLPKEAAVGAIFAAGVALPAWSRLVGRGWEFLLLAILFAAVCTLNCVAIEEWERVRGCDRDGGCVANGVATGVANGSDPAARNFVSGDFAAALAICAALLTPVVRLRGEFSAIGAAIAASALLILMLDLMRERISAEALRVLVDLALLVPAIAVLAFLR
jgi:hypothetical protein